MSRRCGVRTSLERVRRALATTTVALVAVGGGLAAGASAAAVPTSVTLFDGSTGSGNFSAMVAVQRLAAGSVRITGLITGLPAGNADIAIVPTASCGHPVGHELLRVHIPAGGAFDARGQAAADPSGAERRWRSSSPTTRPSSASGWRRSSTRCRRSPASERRNAATGVVALRRSGGPVDLLAMTKPTTSALSARLASQPCATASAANQLLQVSLGRKAVFFYTSIFASNFPKLHSAKSLTAVNGTAAVGCAKWQLSDYDALMA